MKKVVRYGVLFLLALAIVATCTAGASLLGTSFGFPSMFQSGQTTAFNQDIATGFNNEAVNIGLPCVSQTAVQGQTLRHTDFAQTTETASFAYPMVETGMGFSGFGIGGFGSRFGLGRFC